MKKFKKALLVLMTLTMSLGFTVGATACEFFGFGGNTANNSSSPTDSSTPDSSSPDSGNPDSGTPSGPSAEELAQMGETLKAAYALEKGATLEGTHTLTGVVTNVKSTGENEACLTFVVTGYDEYPMYCYWLKGEEAETLREGDTITVTGTIKNYNGTIEYDKANLDSFVKGERPPLNVTTTPGTGIAEGYEVISIEMAQAICEYVGETPTEERYYIHATVDTVSNAKYGAMYISDDTGSIAVYGTYSADGAIGYAEMTDKPYKGAEVLLSCTLHAFKDEGEVKNARLVAFKNIQLNESDYADMTLADARAAADDTLVKVDGVVARITYANGMIPNGVYLVDNTDSLYIYDKDLAARVAIGNKITVLGKKTHWILDTEISNAQKYEYKGGNQIEEAWLVSNDNGSNEWDKSWIQETTVKNIMDTPVSQDITNTIYKVNAVVKESQGTGFVNYYIDDLDETTGSYVYTQCNGSDFAWLKAFATNKVYTVYLSVINAKSSAAGCVWRFVPIAVEDDGYQFDKANAAKFLVEYYGVDQFETTYYADPALKLNTKVGSTLLGFEAQEIKYTSDNTNVVKFEKNAEGVYEMHCVGYGTANVTISCEGLGGSYAKTIAITYAEAPTIASITVAQTIAASVGTEVTVKGIVGPSLINKQGFYLFGEDGSMIAVQLKNATEAFADIAIGNEVILKGTRDRKVKDENKDTRHGQTNIMDATIEQNNFGSHEYSTAKFVTNKTVADLCALDIKTDYSTTVFVVKGVLNVPSSGYVDPSIQADGKTFSFYKANASQYAWLQPYSGQEVTIEIAACNWNDKTAWKGCVLAVRTADGKVLNTFNFNSDK